MTNGMNRDPGWYEAKEQIDRINRKHVRRVRIAQIRRKLLFPFRGLAKPKDVVWVPGYGGKNYPCCPRCMDIAYYADRCIFCGQRFTAKSPTVGKVLDYER